MYTILVTNDNELITSVKERIMQKSKCVDTLHFLVDPLYKDIDMTDFTVMLEYVLPISGEYHSEILERSEELYKEEKLEYKLPFDTALTKEAGDIEVQLTFTKVDVDTEGNNIQYVRKTSTTKIIIVPITAWSNIVPDSALNAIDEKILKLDGLIKEIESASGVYVSTKADNIVLDTETHELYLTSGGEPIGNRIKTDDLGDSIVESSSDEGLITVVL